MTRKILLLTFILMAFGATPVGAWQPEGYPWLGNEGPLTMGIHDYTWTNANGGQWVDNRCDTSNQKFKIAVFKHKDYQGPSTRICHNFTEGGTANGAGVVLGADFCEVPMGENSNIGSAFDCILFRVIGLTHGVAQDKISSVNIIGGVPDGKCIRLYSDIYHRGWFVDIDKDTPDLHAWGLQGIGDKVSSIKKVSC